MKKSKVYVADIETTTEAWKKDESRMYIWGLKSNTSFDYGVDWRSFFETLLDKKVKLCYFHNLSFDGMFMCHWLLENGYKWGRELREDGAKWTWVNTGGNIYSMDVLYKGFQITFLCSYKLLQASVKAIGEALSLWCDEQEELEKKSLAYDKYTTIYKRKEDIPNELIEYLERDCEIPLKQLEIMTRQIEKEGRVKKVPMTSASLAMKDWEGWYKSIGKDPVDDFGGKRIFNKQVISNWLFTPQQWFRAAKCYFGGWVGCGVGYEGVDVCDIVGYSYDINSSYPTRMQNEKLPYGPMIELQDFESDLDPIDHIMIYEITITEMEMMDKVPAFIPDIKAGMTQPKYISKIDKSNHTDISIHKDELEFIKSNCKKFNYILRGRFGYKTKNIFEEWIRGHYGERLAAKKAKDAVLVNYKKLIMNSAYGKWGQAPEREERIIRPTGPDDRQHQLKYGLNDEWTHENVHTNTEEYRHVGVAARITSLARMALWKGIVDNKDNFLYGDTDSMYLKDEAIKGSISIDNITLGGWKPEHIFYRFKALRPKLYMYYGREYGTNVGDPIYNKEKVQIGTVDNEIIIKSAGLSKDGHRMIKEKVIGYDKDKIPFFAKRTINEVFTDFNRGVQLYKCKKAKVNVKGGVIIHLVDFKL